MDLKELSNKELYQLCKEYGVATRKWRRKFAYLLPEVFERGMYRKYGCESIYQFASKIGGLSQDVTQKVLRLSNKLEDKPLLWAEFEKYGWSKLSVIANIVTKDTEEFWIDKLRKLPKAALAEYVRNLKENSPKKEAGTLFDSFSKPEIAGALSLGGEIFRGRLDENSKRSATGWPADDDLTPLPAYDKLKFKVAREAQIKFRKIKRELERKRKESLTMGEVLEYLIEKEDQQVEVPDSTQIPIISKLQTTATRYIPTYLKRAVIAKTGGECSVPGCRRPYEELHHPQRFALNKSHEGVIPVCKIHHQLAHGLGDSYIDKKARKYWQLE